MWTRSGSGVCCCGAWLCVACRAPFVSEVGERTVMDQRVGALGIIAGNVAKSENFSRVIWVVGFVRMELRISKGQELLGSVVAEQIMELDRKNMQSVFAAAGIEFPLAKRRKGMESATF